FNGPADRVGNEVRRLQNGSCGGRGRRREPSSSHRRTHLHIVVPTDPDGHRATHSGTGRAGLVSSECVCDPLPAACALLGKVRPSRTVPRKILTAKSVLASCFHGEVTGQWAER